ncbi:Endonuclease/exonuclease/phosphatase [Phycomyces nitens]|nr:Endonuclease/exonuclease/phosphatase [Phycomyces nitens]
MSNTDNQSHSADPQGGPSTSSDYSPRHSQITVDEADRPLVDQSTPLSRAYSQDSVVSTQSAPPPYELYPRARSLGGRIYNWLRKIPRFGTHQAIYLPTLPTHRTQSDSHSTASSSVDSIASSNHTPWCVSLYERIYNAWPTLPRFVLTGPMARLRTLLLCISFSFLFLFSFLLFCAVYFSPAQLPLPVVPDKVALSSASFLTLNIFMRPPGIQNNWSDYKDDRLDYIVRFVLPKYDVIAFQESFAFGTRRKDHLIKEARALGFNHHVESDRHFPWELAVDGGLLLLSRFPILESNAVEYPRGAHSDWLARKGALHCLIQLKPGYSMHVYTTHAQASYELDNMADVHIRLSQFAELHSLMRNTAKKDDFPILLMGDLNVDASAHKTDEPITKPSKESGYEYNLMMGVLSGEGALIKEGARLYEDPEWVLKMEDIVYKAHQHHPVTFGDVIEIDGELVPAETVLTDSSEMMTMESIDRMLWAGRGGMFDVKTVALEKFLISENKALGDDEKEAIQFTQISDHYGLSCVLELS